MDHLDASSPARRYYERVLGRWSGHFTLAITKWSGAPFSLKTMGILAKLSGGAKMATTVDARGDTFHHTTKVSRLGIAVVTTEETIAIERDGKSVRMTGIENGRAYEATALIADDAESARYEIPWMGLTIVQKTRIIEDGRLHLVQETPYSRASVVLVRAP